MKPSPLFVAPCALIFATLGCGPHSSTTAQPSEIRGAPDDASRSSSGGAASGAQTTLSQRRPSGGGTRPSPGRYKARPCRDDAIFIDAPLALGPSWSNLNFVSQMQGKLTQQAANEQWFCDGSVCPNEAVSVDINPVLQPRAAAAFRSDGHLRFLRVTFRGEKTGAPYELGPDGRCLGVKAVRTAFLDSAANPLAALPPESVYVGRECDASAMSLLGSPSQQMLDWHLSRIDADRSAVAVSPPASGRDHVDFALVDAGIDLAVGNTLGVSSRHSEAGQTPAHRHGTAMAILARQLAPQAALHDIRVLTSGGSGTSAMLARGLDHALYSIGDNDRPLVINMSLGWPSELSQSAEVLSPTCSSHEDPFGEAVRYLLDVARRLDETTRSIAVVSAAGNRPLDVPAGSYPPGPGFVHECSQQTLLGNAWFFPAQWQRTDSCRPQMSSRRLALAAGAVDIAGQPAVVTIADGEAPLVAPGQHVMVASTAAASTPNSCGPGATFPSALRLPGSFTGSSVSAVLTAAAIANAQHLLIEHHRVEWPRDALAKLVYLSGRGLCRSNAEGIDVRQLNVARLNQAIVRPECEPLRQCAQLATGLDVISPNTLADCAGELAQCRLEELGNYGNITAQCPYAPTQIDRLPLGYSSAACHAATGPSTAFDETACPGGVCPDSARLDRFSLGSIGPQPLVGGCPPCAGILDPNAQKFDAYMEINPELPVGTTLDDPHIRIIGSLSDGTLHKEFVSLSGITDANAWQPGKNQTVQLNLSGLGFNLDKPLQVDLLVEINAPDAKKPVKDVSAFIVEVQ